ncbi:MAG: methyltransferase domain-containing protein [Desulfohalobiaceae bacterium]
MPSTPHGAGKSSFDLIDAENLLVQLEPLQGRTVLDLGCGYGDYSLALAERVESDGVVHAVDPWEVGIEELKQRARENEGAPVYTHLANAAQGIPLPDNSVDLCLMAAVLHDIMHDGGHGPALAEVGRVLKPEGTLAVLEFRKIEGMAGPPVHIRLSEDELREVLFRNGFAVSTVSDNGDQFYLSLARRI